MSSMDRPYDGSGTIRDQPVNRPPFGAEPISFDDATVDFAAEAAARFPWLTGKLLDTYAEFWEDTGSPSVALTKLRGTDLYNSTFKGIKREDGTLRMDENQYRSTMFGYAEALEQFEMSPDDWRKSFVQLIEQEVGADEFYRTVEEGYQRFREPGAEDNGLLNEYVKHFVETGSAEVALEQIRASDAYGKVFAGNRRSDGTLRMDETEYFAYKRGWQRLFLSRGLNPEVFESRNRMVEAIEAEVSVKELDNRLTAVEQNILGNRSEVGEFFRSAYGEGYTEGIPQENTRAAVLAMAIDPDVGSDILANRISAAQIGGEAAVQGFARSVERAEELARAGLDQSRARQLYGEAATRLTGLSATTRRFRRGDTSLADFESAMALGNGQQQLRLTRALQSEQSSFGSRRDVLRESDGFGLSGLRQR